MRVFVCCMRKDLPKSLNLVLQRKALVFAKKSFALIGSYSPLFSFLKRVQGEFHGDGLIPSTMFDPTGLQGEYQVSYIDLMRCNTSEPGCFLRHFD